MTHPLDIGSLPLDAFDALTTALEDPRPHPTHEALQQLGAAVMGELLDTLLGTALEDFVVPICETFIGGLHAGAQRVEREADRARDTLGRLLRDFDGSEVADDELQQARRKADAADVAMRAVEAVREAAAEAYSQATGETWSPWRGSARAGSVTAAQLDALAALRAVKARRLAETDPGHHVVAFRAAPTATSPDDGQRIFDALNWAHEQWPDMSLALTGAPGGERLALSWARQKRVRLIHARPQFDRYGRAAPFRANEALMALEPVCVLVLARSLSNAELGGGFGPALNLLELAHARGVRSLSIRRRDVRC